MKREHIATLFLFLSILLFAFSFTAVDTRLPSILLLFFAIAIYFNKNADEIEAIKEISNDRKQSTMSIPVTTLPSIPQKEIEVVIGVVRGNTVRSRNIGRDIGAGLKSLVGGEVRAYTEMTTQARDEAYNRMVNQAIDMGADAVVNVRFTTSTVMAGASEMLAYGTAVKFKN